MDYVNCMYASGEHQNTIRCQDNERIHVWSTTIAVIEKTEKCNNDEVLPALRRVNDSCKFYDPLSFKRYVVTKVVLLKFYSLGRRRQLKAPNK